MADEDVSESGVPYAATPDNVARLRDEAASLLRAAEDDPVRAAWYRKRADRLGQMADRMALRFDSP